MRWKLAAGNKKVSEDMSLQITPMASIFVVILVFLLKGISTNVTAITPSQDLTLPEFAETEEVFDGLRIEIAPEGILVDDKMAMPLRNFEFDPLELAEDGSLKRVNRLIESEKGITLNPAESSQANQRALILADHKTPYSTIKRVLASAANQGYFDMKLMVIGGE